MIEGLNFANLTRDTQQNYKKNSSSAPIQVNKIKQKFFTITNEMFFTETDLSTGSVCPD